jgi:hypothetical protein
VRADDRQLRILVVQGKSTSPGQEKSLQDDPDQLNHEYQFNLGNILHLLPSSPFFTNTHREGGKSIMNHQLSLNHIINHDCFRKDIRNS